MVWKWKIKLANCRRRERVAGGGWTLIAMITGHLDAAAGLVEHGQLVT